MKRGWRILLVSFAVSGLLISPAANLPIVSAQSEEDELRRLYDNNELFEQLSGAARSMLELKFGRKGGEVLEPSPEAPLDTPEAAPSAASYVGNVLVNDPFSDLTDRDTQSETTLALIPGVGVCVGYNDSGSFIPPGTPPGNKFTGFSLSTDGGASFTDKGTLPTNPNGDTGDPVLARDNTSGRIYFSTLFFSGSGLQVFRSDDNCDTFGPPVNGAPGTIGFQDKEWITVDNFAGPGQGNVYMAWRDFGPFPGMRFTRSTDGGNTFSPSGGTLINAGGGQGAFVAVDPSHAVYVFWLHAVAGGREIRVRKSTDQGVTFGPPIVVANLLTTGVNGDLGLTGRSDSTATFNPFRSNSFAHAAVNPVNGNIYVTYNDNPPGVDKGDVFFRQSTNGGATWGAAVRVNDDATTTDQWQPTIAVTPDGTRLGVFWYDRRLDSANNLIDTFGAIGDINGNTVIFGPNFRITDQSFPPEFGRDPAVSPVYMGDYDQAVADNNFFYYTWGDNRLPNPNVPTRVRQADVRFSKIALQAQEQNVNDFVSFTPDPNTFQTTSDTVGCPATGFVGKFSFLAALMNTSVGSFLRNLVVQVAVLTGGNLLQNADGGPGGVGSRLTVPNTGGFSDGRLDPGESVDVPFIICLTEFQPFDFFVDVLGVVAPGGPYAALP